MKLLGWMHRKFWQNSADFAIGQTSLDDQPKQIRKSFAGLDEECEEDSDAISTELFDGFLAIGTLGCSGLSTPTFDISVERITEKENEVTENELKLINDELEKVLGGDEDSSSGRNSYVSAGRSSHGSTITLSGKPLDGQEMNGTTCPLQGYLFGSAVEYSDTTTTTTSSAAKKETRTSLAELFQRTKLAEENNGIKSEKEEKPTEKESAVNLMKKILKKKMVQASSRNSITGAADSASAETKLQKILQIFHRKVHPEISTRGRKTETAQKKAANTNGIHDKDKIMNQIKRSYKSRSNPSTQLMLSGNESNGSRECWIKTDADYLVLEL